MSTQGARNTLITSAMIVAAIRLWMQVRGKTTTPFQEWAIGWGALFFVLAIVSEFAATAAGSMALLVAVADFLKNGVGLTTDLSGLITGSENGSSVFASEPFANSDTAQTTTKTAQTSKSKSAR